MFKVILTILMLCSSQISSAVPTDDFVIRVQTNILGASDPDEFIIPTFSSLTYNYDVDCNDDTINEATGVTGDYTCDYSTLGGAGIKKIRIKTATGTGFPRIYFNDTGDKNKILSVEQWGFNKWESMDSAFQGASNLATTANDAPDFSNLTSLSAMFRDATSVNPNTSNWDTSLVEDMSYMFNNAISANPNTSSWDTSSAINMRHMFDNATAANPDTTYWNTSSTVNMSYMFNNATSANPNTSKWNIENVFNMFSMFGGVTLPTLDYDAMLIGFGQQNVTTSVVFDGGNSKYCLVAARNVLKNGKGWIIIDGNLDSSCPYSSDDFIIAVNTNNASSGSPSNFTIPTFPSLSYNYNVDCDSDGVLETTGETGDYECEYTTKGIKIISIKDNFFGSGFPSIYINNNSEKVELISIEQWGTGHWTTMEGAFHGARYLTLSANAGNPDFSSVSSMEDMFRNAYDANPITLDWDTSSVLNMTNMFNNSYQARPDVRHWDVSQVSAFNNMLNGVTLPTNLYDILLISFATQPIQTNKIINIGSSKYCAIAAHDILDNDKSWIILDGGIDSNCPIPADDFVFTVNTNNPGNSTNQQFTIPTLSSLAYNYDVDCNNDMSYEAIGITGDYTCDYSTMGGVGTYTIRVKTIVEPGFPRIYFNGGGDAQKLLTIEQWGSNQWASMNSAFEGAVNLTTTASDSPDFSNTTSLAEMFKNATSANPTTTNWNTSTITSFTGMFQGATSANPDTSIWNTSLVQRFKYMFDGASNANPNTSSWITNNVLEMEYMFRDATSANPNMTSWNIENVTSIQGMFENVTLPTTTYDHILSTFAVQNVNTGLSFSGGNSKFCAQAAHDFLDITNTWTMTDAGLDSICPDPLGDFVITIKTDHPGTSANTEFTIPALGSNNDYNVDCNNDGINEILGATSDSTCVYPIADTYTVRIKYNQVTNTGFSRIYFNGGGDAEKLLTIEQWGTNPWSSMNGAFRGTTNLTTTAADVPDFSNVTSMNVMFKDATLVTPNTSNWDTSSIKIMYGMFENATLANPDTSNWNTTLVETMSFMFSGSTSANPSTSSWNIEKVTSMVNMFSGVTLPTADYDAMLSGFSQQTVKQDVNFHGGNSKFCAQAAHDILDITNSWNMIDGGLDSNCPTEDIFSDGFENIVITFKSTETSIKYDFGTVSGDSLSETPTLIAQGLNEHDIPTIEINIRSFEGEIQIRRSYLDFENIEDIEDKIWTHDDWQILENKKFTKLYW